ncbi:energy transducer TonB [Marinilabiliaceae bacterium ANBcel2]|nr:energy transducer TonB [Marinilabiliaceae bacterium ANBcel2]
MIEKKSDKRYGMIGSVVFHALLLILFLILGLTSIEREEEGILVMLGDSPTGGGSATQSYSPSSPQPATPPQPSEPEPATVPEAADPEPVDEPVVTQDIEEAPSISAEERERQEAEQRELEEQRRREEEEERRREEEEERQRREEEERRRIEEEERRKREEQERQAQAARDAASRAFSNSGGDDDSQGDDDQTGSQGRVTGDPDGSGVDGSGLGETGTSFDLSGRSVSGALPEPEYEIQETGTVVVEITVDRNGVVTSAEPILRGTTTQNSYLWRVAKEAAEKARFNSDRSAPSVQRGTITYEFVLN